MPSGPHAFPVSVAEAPRPVLPALPSLPRLVRFRQAMPEDGPGARQERLGPEFPEGYETHQKIND